jgi:hypothetical protein
LLEVEEAALVHHRDEPVVVGADGERTGHAAWSPS